MALKIAMIGLRGVPAAWGGVEHHVDELGRRLAGRGHDVTVFNRSNYLPERWRHYRGMRIRSLPVVPTKHLEAIGHSLLATLASATSDFDIVHYHALGPGLCTPIARLVGPARVVLTVHGLENRAKWSGAARRVLSAAEWLGPRVPDETIVVSHALEVHFRQQHNRAVTCVPNGVTPVAHRPPRRIVKRFGLAPGYVLYVGRLSPEKAPDLLLRAYRHVSGNRPLVVAGGSSLSDEYVDALRQAAAADRRVRMLGYVYGEELAELYSNAGVFVLPSLSEGLPLTLLEAASYATPVVASRIPANEEVLSPVGIGPGRRLFTSGSDEALAAALNSALGDLPREREGAECLRSSVLRRYDWDRSAEMTEEVYLRSLVPSGAIG